MKLSIIIPAFNEENTLVPVLKKLKDMNLHGINKEIIVIDDGSTDNTYSNLIKAHIDNVIVIKHSTNKGKGAAVRTGLEKASGEFILIQDADLEYDPSHIEKLLEPIKKQNTEVVYGTRLNRMPNLKRDERNLLFLTHFLGNRLLSLLTSILYGQWLTDMETGYKLFSKTSIDGMKLYSKSFNFEPEITAKFLKRGYKIIEVPIKTNPRGYDEGKKLNTVKDGIQALWTLLKYRIVD